MKFFDDYRDFAVNYDDSSMNSGIHFLGTVYLVKKDNHNVGDVRRFDIVDGQQRITTLILMICGSLF